MNQIFLAPRSSPQSASNFEKTIKDGYDFQKIKHLLSDEDKDVLGNQQKLYIWGNTPGTRISWETMTEGDYIFFYQNRKLTWVGSFLYKTHNKNLADFLWPPPANSQSYEYVFFLKDLVEVDISLKIIIKLTGYKPNYIVQSFIKLQEKSIENLEKEYGSIQDFIKVFSKKNITPENMVPNNIIQTPEPNDRRDIKMIEDFKSHLRNNNLIFEDRIVKRFICSLATKPFVILTGNSGTGKTKIALEFAKWISRNDKKFYEIIPVGADWTDNRPVLGFVNPLKDSPVYYSTPILDLFIRAEKDSQNPYFLILDEMNLSHVERYFSDLLSSMESLEEIPIHKLSSDLEDTKGDKINQTIKLPENVFITGTVNVDETTYMFSPKVLDRANVIEIKLTRKSMDEFPDVKKGNKIAADIKYTGSFLKISRDCKEIEKFSGLTNFEKTKEGLLDIFQLLDNYESEFGIRTLKEAYQYTSASQELNSKQDSNEIIDEQLIQKILPKLNGSKSKLETLLVGLIKMCLNDSNVNTVIEEIEKPEVIRSFKANFELKTIRYPLSYNKLNIMLKKIRRDQFVSFI